LATRLIRLSLALLVSLAFVFAAFKDLNFEALKDAIKALGLAPVGVYLLSIFIIHLLRSYRWHLMIRSLDSSQPFMSSLRISFLGFAAVFLVPLRLGEFARPLLLKRHRGLSMSAGLGTVAVERTVDGLVMVFVLCLAVLASGAKDPLLWTMGGVAGAIFGGAALAFASIALAPVAAERFWRRVCSPLGAPFSDKVIGLLKGFTEGLGSLPTWRLRGAYLACTLGYWGLNAWGMTYLAAAFGMEITYVQGCLVMALLVVGIMIPAGPGSIGTFHAPIVFALVSLFGFAAPQAQAYAIVLHLVQVIHMVVVALPFVGDLSGLAKDKN
jgi:hypothetical protein